MDGLGLALGLGGLVAAFAWLWRRDRSAVRLLEGRLSASERQRDAALRQQARAEDRWQALGSAMLDAVIVVGRNLEVLDASPSARQLFPATELGVGRSLVEWTRSADLRELAAAALTAREADDGDAGCPEAQLDRVIELDDRPFRARVVACGEGAVLVLRDLSELHRLGRARRDLVANISHELRTPLTAIRLLLDGLLGRDVGLPADVVVTLQQVQAEAATLETMAQELVDLDQIESGKAPLRLVPTEVRELVKAAVRAVNAQQRHKRQTLRVEVPPEVRVWADTPQATRALVNVLGNAVKFTPPGGSIRVTASAVGDDIRITVSDSGVGIPPEDLERVFERFYRGDAARGGGSGTGLGLAIARHIIVAHGGRIWAESSGVPGEGATFTMTLPAVEAESV